MAEGNIVCTSELSQELQDLVKKAAEAKNMAHCPYSNFPVGAALLTTSNETFTGCNVENASSPLTVCAERTAIANAVSQGALSLRKNSEKKYIKAIAVTSKMEEDFVTPCGGCRQVIHEFVDPAAEGEDVCIVLCLKEPNRECRQTTVKELLPYAFGPDSLEK